MRLITPTERIALKTAYDQGVEFGRSRGIELGRSQGIELGRSQGIELGRSEGIELGRVEGARDFLFMLGEERMGQCPPDCRIRVEAIQSSELLMQILRKLKSVKSWDEFPIP